MLSSTARKLANSYFSPESASRHRPCEVAWMQLDSAGFLGRRSLQSKSFPGESSGTRFSFSLPLRLGLLVL
jgi:hypothetical protein